MKTNCCYRTWPRRSPIKRVVDPGIVYQLNIANKTHLLSEFIRSNWRPSSLLLCYIHVVRHVDHYHQMRSFIFIILFLLASVQFITANNTSIA